MTDTNSSISVETGKRDGIFVLPMPIIIEDKTFLEGEGISPMDYYRELEKGTDSSTSQPAPDSFISMWDSIFKEGYDEIVYIPMSSGLSGSCETAESFAKSYDGRVQVVDNHRISVTLMDSVYDALKLAEQGLDAAGIKAELEKRAYDQSIYITVTTLKRLIKSGRVTPAGAAIASALNLKPILQIQGEKLDAFAKVRGMKKAEKVMIDSIRADIENRFKDVPEEKLRVRVAGTLTDREEADQWRQQVQTAFPEFEVDYYDLPCSIASHVGHNAVATAVNAVI